jgi:hypothetical protein
MDPVSGLTPNYGSDDGSLIFPLASTVYRDYRPLHQLGAAVLDRPPLQSGPWDEAALWFGVEPAVEKTNPTIPGPSAETGYFRLGNETSWALIRAGQYTRRPFQADQLHVDLWWQGINLARDAGTYLYNGPSPWDNALAGSAVHNTVTVDHCDQMRRAGRFLWLDWAQGSGRVSSPSRPYAGRFEGEHDGYKDLGIKHRRTVHWLAGSGWVIVDDIEGTGNHSVRLHWLAPDLPHQVFDVPFQVVFKLGQSQIRWSIFASVPGSAALVRAGALSKSSSANDFASADIKLLGWESLTYGDLRPAFSMIYETRSQLPVRFVTAVLTDERCRLESIDDRIVILRSESSEKCEAESGFESEVHRVNLVPKTMRSEIPQRSVASVPTA